MAVKRFIIELERENGITISRLSIWEALRNYFVDDLYIEVKEEIIPITNLVLETKDNGNYEVNNLKVKVKTLQKAIMWALGYYSDLPDFSWLQAQNTSPYWWRKYLREYSGITQEEITVILNEVSERLPK